MTMHKSKGLEFDTVILPGLHRQPRNQDSELLLWQERLSLDGHEEWLLAPISATGQDKDPIYKHLEYEQKKRTQLEACRLLYVACTRARKQLHLLAQVKSKEGEGAKAFCPPNENSLLSPIWQSVITTAHFHPAPEVAEQPADAPIQITVRPLQRLTSNWQIPEIPRVELLQPFIANYQYNNRNLAQAGSPPQNSTARLLGTFTHQVMQMIGQQGLAKWQSRNLNDVTPFWRGQLLGLGISPDEVDQAVLRLRDCVERTLRHPKFEWLLSGECRFELPLSVVVDGVVEHRVLDVLRVEGVRAWVVDYKTGLPGDGESVEGFVAREVENYKKVMEGYCCAVRGMGFGEVEWVLYFMAMDEWAEKAYLIQKIDQIYSQKEEVSDDKNK